MHFKRRVKSSCLCQVHWLWSVLDLMAPHNEMTASLMQSFRKQYLKLVLLSGLKYVTNEIFLYKMTNGHLNLFINQFHFDSLLDQGHFVNALDSTLVHFMARATPLLTAYSSHPFCKAKAPLKWNMELLKVVIEANGNYSVTWSTQAIFCPKQHLSFHRLWEALPFQRGRSTVTLLRLVLRPVESANALFRYWYQERPWPRHQWVLRNWLFAHC